MKKEQATRNLMIDDEPSRKLNWYEKTSCLLTITDKVQNTKLKTPTVVKTKEIGHEEWRKE
jgi:hypothetical protein